MPFNGDPFVSSNRACPVRAFALAGAGGPDTTISDADEYFAFGNDNASAFTVTLRSEWQRIQGVYFYTVRAAARGGATVTISAYMHVRVATDQSSIITTVIQPDPNVVPTPAPG